MERQRPLGLIAQIMNRAAAPDECRIPPLDVASLAAVHIDPLLTPLDGIQQLGDEPTLVAIEDLHWSDPIR